MTHEALNKRASQDLWPVIVKNSRLALQKLLDNPDGFETHFRQMAGSSIIKVVYGYEATASNDILFETVSDAVDGFSRAIIVSNFYVNLVPWLQYIPAWFPGAQWKRKAIAWQWQKDQMLNVPYDWTRDKMAAGTAPPSMLRRLLSKDAENQSKKDEDIMRWATGTLFGAGNDTTVATSLIFIVAMAMHPEVQVKAQAEIDSVLRGSRLPDIDDKESMPYVQAIVKEVFRWRSVTPLGKLVMLAGAVPKLNCPNTFTGAAHASIEEDVYKGYRIPKGATMAISNDKMLYSSPERFNPDRFLDPSTPEAPVFGFGRRYALSATSEE
ncbi:O-methylsterigmatocystin oxidoreductase Short=OMST oxidoreductase [Rhizoctonia solani AG-1 IB]|uniref:O-methylsterigmatocystin oxidoreductase Short=OMST oxidoreductase n=1 Tax=Thanatephorus cucumeris (strain AG1-IB / isolate 7/3/14) TaxID=1108050 RepID=M5BT68_THACB|nr:O-methylsterigmatocystin oxidoreductase Short=OMST oxidoreductase [Rhizoctonia solani AG-1 IB]